MNNLIYLIIINNLIYLIIINNFIYLIIINSLIYLIIIDNVLYYMYMYANTGKYSSKRTLFFQVRTIYSLLTSNFGCLTRGERHNS